MRIALLTNPYDEISGSFLNNIAPSLFNSIHIDIYTVKMKYKDFSLTKKIIYFLKFVGLIRYLKHILRSRSNINVNCISQKLGLSVCFTDINTLEKYLRENRYDVGIVVSLGHILSNKLLRLPRLGFFNFHPGSLVDNRGPSPIFWNLYNNEDYLTVTLHKMTSKIDVGKVIAENKAEIDCLSERKLVIEAGKLAAEIFNESILDLQQIKGYDIQNGIYRKRPTVFRRYILDFKKIIRKFNITSTNE